MSKSTIGKFRECRDCGIEKHWTEFIVGVRRKYINDNKFCRRCKSCQMDAQAIATKKSNKKRAIRDPRFLLLTRTLPRKSTEASLTVDDIPLPKTCCYLGCVLDYSHQDSREHRPPNLATIDRIDSSKGYTPDNIQVISFLANRMKTDATIEQMLAFAYGVIRTHG